MLRIDITRAKKDARDSSEQVCSAEVVLEDGNTLNSTTVNECDVDGTVEAAQGEKMTDEETSSGGPVTHSGHKRSLIWRYFNRLEGLDSALCHLCMKAFQCCEGGGTSNLHRHMSKRHPEVYSRLLAEGRNRQPPNKAARSNTSGDRSASPDTVGETEQSIFSAVEIALENGDNPAAVIRSDMSMVNGSVEPAQEGHTELIKRKEINSTHPVTRRRHTRSLIWRHFEHLESLNGAQCRICMKKLQCFRGGGTSNLRRHISTRHPEVFSRLLAEGRNRQPPSSAARTNTSGDRSASPDTVGTTEQSIFSAVEIALENGDNPAAVIETNMSLNNGPVEPAWEGHTELMKRKETKRKGTNSTHPVTKRRHTRSLIWRHFEHLESLNGARCRICMKKLQCFRGGATSNLHRHMSTRHPEVFSRLLAEGRNRQPPSSAAHTNTSGDRSASPDTVGTTEQSIFSAVEIALENGDNPAAVIGTDMSMVNGSVEPAWEGHTELMKRKETNSNHHPVTQRLHTRSLIWRHFKYLESLDGAQCRICMKKLQCFRGGSTSNLCRHMSKRHPEVFSTLMAEGRNRQSNSTLSLDGHKETWTSSKTVVLKGSRVPDGKERVWRRERQLIEELRRAQKQEAQALEHQRELLEKLRAADAREAAAEREAIKSMRKEQEEEAKDLKRQREELQKEKEVLQKKWEEFQLEREHQ